MSNPLAILWKGRANIIEYVHQTDPITHQTISSQSTTATDEPCRISYNRETITSPLGVPSTTQTIVLFIRPDIEIKAGAVIEVTQNGETVKYKGASTPSKYTNHQEIVLELYEEHA